MIASRADICKAFYQFQDDLDADGVAFDWAFEEVKQAFEDWLARVQSRRVAWTQAQEHAVATAMSQRCQPYLVSDRRWFR
ncbi:hypothetical protein [Caulobacter sp.]|uniref:hypothetical protein n=1 Tax=Caulobacter sp. TaxID=78 RepID=UPI001B0FD87D|nr:hypothetical protein [Caulobacter sp.]MBO9545819.1 hypothetical protein [Caulobacter sp.]